MSDRSFILNLLFEKHCTPSVVVRLEKVNELLLDLTNRTYKRTASLARKVLLIPREELDDDLTVEGKLVPEFDLTSSVLRLEDDAYYGSDFLAAFFSIGKVQIPTNKLRNASKYNCYT